MTLRLPTTLATDSDAAAIAALTKYYGRPYLGDDAYVGAHFDSWSSTGDRAGEADRFTADDLVAVTFLSVQVPPKAARAILHTEAEALNALLTAIGSDRDLVDEPEPLTPGWPAWDLETALWALPGIGQTKATKLIARKRPRLYPIWDSVVSQVLGTERAHLNPVREALRADDGALHRRLLSIRKEAGLPEEISALRVFDVIAWMDGKNRRLGEPSDQER
ncbi:hypothetical protein OPAG_08304 [Rhodococcus opacus PD630]|uniref:DUF6308 family protein n=1 Tax=Rhodococcus opacus TaxID=37919 RepID=UPI00029CCD6B|nr:DUF6308 family protein [Rhodococcus opacus]AHK35671.1 hypothetical protein Pd630_LPD11096 [Rhodococcus opacus PD630]EHI43766.1 hypothetical protein OPAG_08304 [Rhodococcus opacus PD630]UDH01135.1 hypothetical protein K2Z90_007578 [Rhodococcus opacus PD630]